MVKEFMYKLIAIDMDGTLLKNDKSVSDRTKKAIKEAQEKGVNVVIATGRPIDGVTRYLEELDMYDENDCVLTYNGGLVLKTKSREVISKVVLTGADLHYLHNLSKELGVNIHAFSEVHGLITPKNSKYTEVEANINGINIGINDYSEIEDDRRCLCPAQHGQEPLRFAVRFRRTLESRHPRLPERELHVRPVDGRNRKLHRAQLGHVQT